MKEIRQTIEAAFEERGALDPANPPAAVAAAVTETLNALDQGRVRVAEPGDTGWKVNEWVKKAVLLYFRLHENRKSKAGALAWYDKVPLKYEDYDEARFRAQGARVVPPATIRFGAYISPDVVLMPSYVNLGAWIGPGTMVDTWATVGSCAQIGAGVHISGGAGIGGVLEPLQAAPTIVEDGCFIGARSEIVEGVIVERGAVVSMGVFIGQSTPIYDRSTGEITHGRVPAGAVVVPGSLPASDGSHSLSCAVIVKRVDERTRAKVGINELLRNAQEEDRG